MPDIGGDFEPFVVGVLPSRQQGVVPASGGFTPGYGDTVFQTGGASVFSRHTFRLPSYRGTAFQAAVCGARLRGLHHRLSRCRLHDGRCGYAFRARVPPNRLQRYCLPGSCVWCVSPGASPQLWRYRLPDGWCGCSFGARVRIPGYRGAVFQTEG